MSEIKMPAQDTTQLKEKILQTIRRRGPSLPVHIANETGLSILFASAFLSELISDRRIKISNLRVGSSPIYFIPGQEPQLEKYSHHLKSKEKDAYLLLKEKKFLEDSKQDPAIRVALRQIKDFAMGFQKNNKVFWRFFTIPESEFEEGIQKEKIIHRHDSSEIPDSIIAEVRHNIEARKETVQDKAEDPIIIRQIPEKPDELIMPKKVQEKKQELNIFDNKINLAEEKPKQEKEKKKPAKKKAIKKAPAKKSDDRFFNRVKEFLNEKSIEILDIISFSKEDIVLKIKTNDKEKILVAYSKKGLAEDEIIKAAKKSKELNLPYVILSPSSPLKKLEGLIEAVRDLDSIERL